MHAHAHLLGIKLLLSFLGLLFRGFILVRNRSSLEEAGDMTRPLLFFTRPFAAAALLNFDEGAFAHCSCGQERSALSE
jgi:hypothetical protein